MPARIVHHPQAAARHLRHRFSDCRHHIQLTGLRLHQRKVKCVLIVLHNRLEDEPVPHPLCKSHALGQVVKLFPRSAAGRLDKVVELFALAVRRFHACGFIDRVVVLDRLEHRIVKQRHDLRFTAPGDSCNLSLYLVDIKSPALRLLQLVESGLGCYFSHRGGEPAHKVGYDKVFQLLIEVHDSVRRSSKILRCQH